MSVIVETPLMKQYNDMKSKYPDAIMLFRVGDFYETFDEDARKASKILGITLTKRANGSATYVDLAGFPYHSLDSYMPKLVRAGERVAICEQLEDPKKTKTIVKRGITELITPGVALSDNILENRENNFLASVFIEKTIAGVAMLDYSTGEFFTTEGTLDFISKILASFNPKEVLYDKNKYNQFTDAFGNKYYSYPLEDWVFTEKAANERLLSHFGTNNLKGFGVEDLRYGVVAAGAILEYLKITRHGDLNHIQKITRIDQHEHVWLDRFTINNLEIFRSISDGGRTLIDVIDHTASPMGARNLKRWVSMPLINPKKINDRLGVVEYFINNQDVKNDIFSNIFQIGDLERLLSKISALKVNPRELLQLKNSLELIEPIKNGCNVKNNPILSIISEQLNPCKSAIERIEKTIHSEAPNQVSKGGVIADGISEELDDLRSIAYSGKDYLVKIQQDEITRTGINSLKIGFNSVFGYYFEVRNTYKDQVPSDWTRKQTLTGAERYINQELKEYEGKILGAEEKILSLETEIYNNLVISLCEYIPSIQLNASMIANLDCLINFASIAIENEYVKPIVDDSYVIDIKAGRHPVIEKQLPVSEKYIPNDVFLDNETQQIIIITGPNMAGKSALLRQTALIALMAQIGSYVPASDAHIGYVDRIFTRVGASDNIAGGESTFMVEMTEASNILNNLTNRSLVLFDELGRGTSTYDGISIAWSICEFLHENPNKAKTLFATHYHELNELEADFSRIKNYNVSVKELGSTNPNERKIIFLRKLQKGGSNHSFGIHVAQIAGMPKSIVNRANEVLKELEGKSTEKQPVKNVKEIAHHREGYQLSIFQLDDPLLADIRKQIESIDVNNITPIEALNTLDKIKRLLGK